MQTQIMNPPKPAVARLEFTHPQTQEAQAIPLERFPFVLGRQATADFQAPSTRVSREHCVFELKSGKIALRDLGSTNGTFVNGKRVQESPLADGDLVLAADLEFTFFSGEAGGRANVTQIMGGGDTRSSASLGDDFAAVIDGARRLQEALCCRALDLEFAPVIDLRVEAVVGMEALAPGDHWVGRESTPTCGPQTRLGDDAQLLALDCRLTARWRELHRWLALEVAASWPDDATLFLNVSAAEVGADDVLDSLRRAREVLGKRRLVVEIPDSAVCDIPFFRAFHAALWELEVGVLYDGFAGSPRQLAQRRDFPPDYLKLAPNWIDNPAEHHVAENLREALAAAEELGSATVVSGVRHAAQRELAARLGCVFAQGPLWGPPPPGGAWPAASRLSRSSR